MEIITEQRKTITLQQRCQTQTNDGPQVKTWAPFDNCFKQKLDNDIEKICVVALHYLHVKVLLTLHDLTLRLRKLRNDNCYSSASIS